MGEPKSAIVCPQCGAFYVEQRMPSRLRVVNDAELRGECVTTYYVHPANTDCRTGLIAGTVRNG